MHRQQECWQERIGNWRRAGSTSWERATCWKRTDNGIDYFMDQIFPVLTPSPSIRPIHFLFIPNRFCLIALMRNPRRRKPFTFSFQSRASWRFVRLSGSSIRFMLLEDLIEMNLGKLFPGSRPCSAPVFGSLDSEMEIDEEAEDLVRIQIGAQAAAPQQRDPSYPLRHHAP